MNFFCNNLCVYVYLTWMQNPPSSAPRAKFGRSCFLGRQHSNIYCRVNTEKNALELSESKKLEQPHCRKLIKILYNNNSVYLFNWYNVAADDRNIGNFFYQVLEATGDTVTAKWLCIVCRVPSSRRVSRPACFANIYGQFWGVFDLPRGETSGQISDKTVFAMKKKRLK